MRRLLPLDIGRSIESDITDASTDLDDALAQYEKRSGLNTRIKLVTAIARLENLGAMLTGFAHGCDQILARTQEEFEERTEGEAQ